MFGISSMIQYVELLLEKKQQFFKNRAGYIFENTLQLNKKTYLKKNMHIWYLLIEKLAFHICFLFGGVLFFGGIFPPPRLPAATHSTWWLGVSVGLLAPFLPKEYSKFDGPICEQNWCYCWWCWWLRNPKQPPGYILKPCKWWDELSTTGAGSINSNSQLGRIPLSNLIGSDITGDATTEAVFL